MTHNSKNSMLITTPTRPTLRRYSLSDIGYTSPSNKERSKYSPMQEHYTSELSYKCTHIDSKSPGYATRVVQYNEEQEKSLPISQSRYNRPGVFPVVHFFKKDLPLKPIHSTPRMNHPADLSKYNTPEHNRMLLETIIQSNSPNKAASTHSNEVNTKSVLDALKEISRKRIHSNEEDFLMNESVKRACMNSYVTGSNLRKRANLNSSQTEISPNTKSHLGNYCSMDELKASYSSMDERPVKKPKIKKIDVVPESANTSFKSPSPVKSAVDVETQTSLDVPEMKEPAIETKKVSNEEKPKVEESSQPSKVKKVLPVKIFDETPLETMRKNRLVALMGSITEEKVKEKQNTESKSISETKIEKALPEKPLVSILAGPTKSPNKTAKHVTFNIPEPSSSTTSAESSNTSYSAASNDLKSRPEANIITKTSAALVTPIVSSHVSEMSPIKQPEMKSDNSQLVTSTSNIIWSPKQDSSVVNFKPTVSSSNQSSSSGQINAANANSQPTFNFVNNNFMMASPVISNEQLSNSGTTQVNQISSKSEKPVFFSKPLETSQSSSPKGGFKFNLSSPATVPSAPFKIAPSASQNNMKVSTANVPRLAGANTMLPAQTTVALTGAASSTTNFQISSNGFNTGTGSNFTMPGGSIFPSGQNKPPTNIISPSFATTSVESNKALASNAVPPNIFNTPSTTAVTSSNFMTSSSSTSKPPTFAFPVSFKPATPGMFDSLGKAPNVTITASGQPTVTQSNTNNSAAPAFNKPIFAAANVPFASMFSGNGSGAANSTTNNPPFATGAFNANNSIFSGNNLTVPSFKNDNSSKPPFGQDNPPQFGPATASVFPNNTQTTNAFAATTNAFAAPTNTFTPTTNAFATTTNAFSTTKNLFATTNAFAPTTNAFAPTTNAFATTTNGFPATTNAFAATTNTFAPTTNAFATTTNAFAPTTNTFAPTTNTFAPTTNAFAATTNTFAPTTNAFAPTTNAFATTTNAFATTTSTTSNIFGNTSFGIPATTAPTFNSNPPSNFGTNTFGMNQTPGFSGATNNAAPVFGTLFGTVTTTPSLNPAGNFPTNSTVFSPGFANNATAKPSNFEVGQFQGASNTTNAFGTGNFPGNAPTTQGEVFTFGNSNKPAVFSFGSSEPSKATFNFSGENNAGNFAVNNKGFGGAFAAAQPTPPQFNMQGAPPGMFNIGIGSTPNRSRTQLKAKRRT